MPAPELGFYLWQGERVLKNYSTGVVLIRATSEEDAWAKLKQFDESAYYQLQTGKPFAPFDDDDDQWEVVRPVFHTAYDLPIIVKHGGE